MAHHILTILLLLPSAFASEQPLSLSNTNASSPQDATNLTPPTSPNLNPRGSPGWSPAIALQDSQGICPQYAYINCQSITAPNYCCGQGTYCAYGGEANHIGCCADSIWCSGEAPAVQTTVWVPSATGSTWWSQSGTTFTGLIGPAYTVTTTTTATQYIGGNAPTICSTMYAHGDKLPTTAVAQCGLVLVLNDGVRQGGGMEMMGLAVLNAVAVVVGWMGLL